MADGETPGSGGRYERQADGSLKLVEPPTQDHPEGNRARDADGQALDAPAPGLGPGQAAGETPAPPRARRKKGD